MSRSRVSAFLSNSLENSLTVGTSYNVSPNNDCSILRSYDDSMRADQDGTEFHPDPAGKLSSNLYNMCQCLMYSS